MAETEQLSILRRGGDAWNAWRKQNPNADIDLRAADLQGLDLVQANLSFVDLSSAQLNGANLTQADLGKTRLGSANLSGANLTRANLKYAQLDSAAIFRADLTAASATSASFRGALLVLANLTMADLSAADLTEANLLNATIIRTKLDSARLSSARLEWTVLGGLDLSNVIGLEDVSHTGPSTIGVDTIFRSGGRIPEEFLRGVGLDDAWIRHVRSLAEQVSTAAQLNPRGLLPLQFSSCFISYSTEDDEFAGRLYHDLQGAGVRCWFAPRDIRAGRKIHQQIEEAIRTSDRLLLIISESSMTREWVRTEIAQAREHEYREKRQMLFPISVVPFERIRGWTFPDPDSGKDAAREIREYFIPDFSNWRNQAAYEVAFRRLLDGLRLDAPDR